MIIYLYYFLIFASVSAFSYVVYNKFIKKNDETQNNQNDDDIIIDDEGDEEEE